MADRQFEMEIAIDAPRDAVWKALTEAPEVARWFAPRVEITPGVGGSVRWQWGESHDWPQRIEVWEPGSHLRTSYASSCVDGDGVKRPLFVDFHLSGEAGRTTLRLVHHGFGPEAAFDAEYDGISRGWSVELRSLRLYLEEHRGRDRQVVWSVERIGVDHEAAWQRIVGSSGLGCGAGITALGEGEPFRFTTADGDAFEGTVLRSLPHEFAGVVANRGNAFLRFTVEDCGGESQVWLWLAAYGRPAQEVEGLQRRFDACLKRLFQEVALPSGTVPAAK